jgi:hypothetical protein
MQFVPFEAGIEVRGLTVYAVVDGFGSFKRVPSDILLELGVGRAGPDGLLRLHEDEWIPQALWLQGFELLSRKVGDGALFGVGQKLPANAVFPPWVVDVHSAIKSVDFAYHMNHRKHGQLMLDEATGLMLEGIGHYGYAPTFGEDRIVARCENPYPCDFDRGLLTALARKFAKQVWVEHLEPETCRKKGADHCSYAVTWRL